MSIKDVTNLRKSGRIEEAYKMAVAEWNEDPNNPWTQMSLFWVLRDLCQRQFDSNNVEKAKIYLSQMFSLLPTMMDNSGAGERAYARLCKQLHPHANVIAKAGNLSKSEPVKAFLQVKELMDHTNDIDPSLHEEMGWILYRYLKAESASMTSVQVRTLLKDYIFMKNDRPSMLHSQMLIFALGFARKHLDFNLYSFFMLWNPENLLSEDYKKSYYDGKDISPLVERILHQMVNNGEKVDIKALCNKLDLSHIETVDLLRKAEFWKIMNLHAEGKTHEMFDAFAIYNKTYAGYGASRWHSEILKIAERFMTGVEARNFVYFFKNWNYENFMSNDWKEETGSDGNVYPSLAVKAAKKCYDCVKAMSTKDIEMVAWLQAYYTLLIDHIKKDEWILRQQAFIYIWQQKYELAKNIYKHLLLELSDKYYIWSELAGCIQDNDDLKMALLCKALAIERNEDYIGTIHLSLARLLIKAGRKSEALYELNTYKKYNKKEPVQYKEYMVQIENTVVPARHNKELYCKMAYIAEKYAFSNIEAQDVVLADRWQKNGKNICFFTNGSDLSFQVNAKRFPLLNKAALGTVFSAKCHRMEKEGQTSSFVPLCLYRINGQPWDGLPEKFGYVEYLNKEKQILHIVTQNSKRAFKPYTNQWGTSSSNKMSSETCLDSHGGKRQVKPTIDKGDFVRFREYILPGENDMLVHVANIEKVDEETALPWFSSGTVLVDNVNEQKQLFHYTFGPGKIGGIVFFKDTALRPIEGQILNIIYCVTRNKQGQKKAIALQLEEFESLHF